MIEHVDKARITSSWIVADDRITKYARSLYVDLTAPVFTLTTGELLPVHERGVLKAVYTEDLCCGCERLMGIAGCDYCDDYSEGS